MISLITRLILTGGASILLISGILVYVMINSVEEQTARITESKKEQVDLLATTIQNKLDGIVKVLATTSRLEDVYTTPNSAEISDRIKGIPEDSDMKKRLVAMAILDQYPSFDNVAFTMPNGDMYVVEPYQLQTQLSSLNFAFRDWYNGVIRTNAPYLSEVFEAESTREQTVKIAVPARNSYGMLSGIWGGIINLGFLEIESAKLQPHQNGHLILFDHKANPIFDTTGSSLSDFHMDILSEHIMRSLKGNSGSTVYEFDGQRMVAVYQPVAAGSLFWSIVLVEPYEEVFHSVNVMQDQLYMAVGAVTAIAIGSSYLRIQMIRHTMSETVSLQKDNEHFRKMLSKYDKKYKDLESKYHFPDVSHDGITKKHVLVILVMGITLLGIMNAFAFYEDRIVQREFGLGTEPMRSGYVIQNLRGDTVDTWLSWRLVQGTTLSVNIQNLESVDAQKQAAIKEAILSDDVVEIDDSILHKGPSGSTSIYYKGWLGALQRISDKDTRYYLPTEIQIIEGGEGEGDIVIRLAKEINPDGFSGYTKSISDQNQILKSTITIYDVDRISTEGLKTITRHEFGHALGLAHSTAPEDLMAPQIQTDYPFISDCDLDALLHLYNGSNNSSVVCKK